MCQIFRKKIQTQQIKWTSVNGKCYFLLEVTDLVFVLPTFRSREAEVGWMGGVDWINLAQDRDR